MFYFEHFFTYVQPIAFPYFWPIGISCEREEVKRFSHVPNHFHVYVIYLCVFF